MSLISKPLFQGRWRLLLLVAAALLTLWWVVVLVSEFTSSSLQARYFSNLARESQFQLKSGPSSSIVFPETGPYDQRLGYSHLPGIIERLSGSGFEVQSQTRFSPRLVSLSKLGLTPAYHEKSQAGLEILDRNHEPIFNYRYPERVYRDFNAVPRLIMQSLLFIENRDLFDPDHPTRNPAVEWDRLAKAVMDQALHAVHVSAQASGGSTLATQIEKYRHSPDGRTASVREKLRQMASASVRAYLDGEEVSAARQRIVLDYLNSVPLAAKSGYGEVNGLGDGLWVWFGKDFREENDLLMNGVGQGDLETRARAYKEVLSLMISQRRPSYYLAGRQGELEALTDSYLRLLAKEGVIDAPLRDAALRARLEWRRENAAPQPVSYVTRKAATAIRADLSSLLGVSRVYDLDRMDLSVATTLDGKAQRQVTEVLRQLDDPAKIQAAGLRGEHLLTDGDPAKVIYSFTLFERAGDANLLRVQTDNLDQPFDLNQGAKLDLGSTAKLRTVIHYLEIITNLHRRYQGLSPKQLKALPVDPHDHLSRWAADYLMTAADKSLPAMLDAALDRKYSASPYEVFFTGGGIHSFHNFDEEDNRRILTVRQGFRNSVNLVFVRLMRDIVYHHMYGDPAIAGHLKNGADPERRLYLTEFADREGRAFLARFYRKYQGKNPDQVGTLLSQGATPSPKNLAAMFFTLEPTGGRGAMAAFLHARLPEETLPDEMLDRLYKEFAAMSLADRGYVLHIHPLELWLTEFLRQHPGAKLAEVMEASADERQEAYQWLFKTSHRGAQDARIRDMREVEAFRRILYAWKRLGYPFDSLVPSYATALGSSADRPAALAELIGIIANNGMRLPVMRINKLHFASATPYETVMAYRKKSGERVLPAEIAGAVHGLLVDVVEQGTARRSNGAFVDHDGGVLEVGGKTGTGDHRFDIFGHHGELLESRVVNRAATFVFMIGNRFFGVITAYVPGPQAADYSFTSALPVQLLKMLAPALMPLIDSPPAASLGPNLLVQARVPLPKAVRGARDDSGEGADEAPEVPEPQQPPQPETPPVPANADPGPGDLLG